MAWLESIIVWVSDVQIKHGLCDNYFSCKTHVFGEFCRTITHLSLSFISVSCYSQFMSCDGKEGKKKKKRSSSSVVSESFREETYLEELLFLHLKCILGLYLWLLHVVLLYDMVVINIMLCTTHFVVTEPSTVKISIFWLFIFDCHFLFILYKRYYRMGTRVRAHR